MGKRDELFRKFGPILLEAVLRIQLAETNRLRHRLSMPVLEPDDVLRALENELEKLTEYDWMKEVEDVV